MTYYHLTDVSRNMKLGPMPVSTVSDKTCPPSCPFANGGGCYANFGPLAIHWKKISEGNRGENFDQFLRKVSRIPFNIWRYGQAGDLPGNGDEVDYNQLMKLVNANKKRHVIAYTHKPLTENNLNAIRDASKGGFHINISTETLDVCDQVIEAGLSAVTVLPSTFQRGKTESLSDYKERTKGLTTPQGVKIAICPATYTDTNCLRCQACAKPRAGNAVIAFPAHGVKKRVVDRRVISASVPVRETDGGVID